MIVRIYHDPGRPGVRTVTDNGSTFVQESADEAYFSQEILAATQQPGSFAYYEANKKTEGDFAGDLEFGAVSTADAFASGR